MPDIRQIEGPKIILWGNSLAVSFHDIDAQKIHMQFNSLWKKYNSQKLTAFGAHFPESDIATPLLLMREYEHIAKPVIYHIIMIDSVHYILPSLRLEGADRNQFLAEPEPHFYRASKIESGIDSKIKYALTAMKADFFRLILARIRKLKLDFSVKTYHKRPVDDGALPLTIEEIRESWDFLFQRLARVTEKPVAFLYSPAVPAIKNGILVMHEPHEELIYEFKKRAEFFGFEFIDMREDFVQFYEQTGLFPRGHKNHHPTSGHFNSQGNHLIAEKLVGFLENKKDAILPA
ncbi:hypothetical protein N9K06_00965 [Omnitrophica bacterium]|nr:hypothetical protein [Candidatus Omnitrophota bacterium]